MKPWIIFIALATLLYGTLHFLYKVAKEKGLNAEMLVNVVGGTVALLALASLFAMRESVLQAFTSKTLQYAFFNGLCFGLANLSAYAALGRSPAAIVFPVARLNTVLVMLIGVFFFKDSPTGLQYGGMALAVTVVLLVAYEEWRTNRDEYGKPRLSGLLFALMAALFFALSLTISKLAAISSESRLAYIAASYALIFCFTLITYMAKRIKPPYARAIRNGQVLGFGMLIGLLNYVGYLLVLQAFVTGPLSLVQAIFSTSIVITIVLAYFVYKESFTIFRVVAVGCAIGSVVMISWKQ